MRREQPLRVLVIVRHAPARDSLTRLLSLDAAVDVLESLPLTPEAPRVVGHVGAAVVVLGIDSQLQARIGVGRAIHEAGPATGIGGTSPERRRRGVRSTGAA